MGEWSHCATDSEIWHYMVSGQLHVPSTVPMGKEAPVPNERITNYQTQIIQAPQYNRKEHSDNTFLNCTAVHHWVNLRGP
jgi:hypothetical protein